MKPFAYYCEERNANGELIDKEYNGINQFSAGRFGKPLYTAEQLEAAVLAEREACAKVCDGVLGRQNGVSAVIRARGKE